METVLDFLVDQQKITLDRKVEIQNQLKNPQYRHANETNDDNGNINDFGCIVEKLEWGF